ncbi:hypothetical protein V8G54_001316 [Vigna mungo]|uniref:Uncharacterized protein n=1 Tax=Vigna mungo TaxID=3915 RepID=A0AAQ3S9U2_VIGMU
MRNHCDWNSVLESAVNGVPMVAWPLLVEQKIKVVMRVAIGENGLVERGEFARVVKMVMEGDKGKKLLHRMKQLKAAAATALRDGGSSVKEEEEVRVSGNSVGNAGVWQKWLMRKKDEEEEEDEAKVMV